MNEVIKKKILIVDDDPGDILWFKRIINSHYAVIEAQDGLHAVEMATREHPDLILLDVMMPNISGYTLCARLKENPNTKDIPVVMVTGLGTDMNKIIGKTSFKNYVHDVRQDFHIWENKAYIAPPALAKGDGPVGKYRSWCKQFYLNKLEVKNLEFAT